MEVGKSVWKTASRIEYYDRVRDDSAKPMIEYHWWEGRVDNLRNKKERTYLLINSLFCLK